MPTRATSDITARFADRFRGLLRAHGIYKVTGRDARRGKMKGTAKTVKEQVTIEKWNAHLKGETGIGIVPVNDEAQASFGALDIDVYEGLDLEDIETKIKTNGFPLIVCRTKSGGAHLYLFTKEAVPASLIREKLSEWAVMLGHPKVEVFPKQSELAGEDDNGSWINIPYFGGDKTDRYAIKSGKPLSVVQFLDYADKVQATEKQLRAITVKYDDLLTDGPPCLQFLSKSGFPEGTRNNALYNLGVLCKLKFGDDWREKLDECNQTYIDPPLSSDEVNTLAKSLARKDYFYKCNDVPIVHACNKSICCKRKFGVGGTKNDPGVSLDGLCKVLTDPPSWLLNIDGRRLRLDSTDDLINQQRFRRLAAERFNVLPQQIGRPAWDDIIRGLLERVEEIEAPDDAGTPGQVLFLLELFCTEHPPARNREELILGKPLTEDGWTYFRSYDFLAYLEKKRIRVTVQQAWSILREIDARAKQFKIKNRCVRTWGVREYGSQTEPLSIPEVKSDGF